MNYRNAIRFLERVRLLGTAQRIRAAIAGGYQTRVRKVGPKFEIKRGRRKIILGSNHEVYLYDIVRGFDYYHGAVLPNISGDFSVVDYSGRRLHKLAKSGVEFEFPSLAEPDDTTEVYLRALNPQPRDVVFDLGAYAGSSTYFFAKAVGPHGKVVSVEPDRLNYEVLTANIERHRLFNVHTVNAGVWSETTTLMFQAEGNMGSAITSLGGRESRACSVGVFSLDDLIKHAGVDRVDAIKMDIEGAELSVLRAASFLKIARPKMVIEPHLSPSTGRLNVPELETVLTAYGYVVTILEQPGQEWPLIAATPH